MPGRCFERFYSEKIAPGEGCGCAEQSVGTRDPEARLRGTATACASDNHRGGR